MKALGTGMSSQPMGNKGEETAEGMIWLKFPCQETETVKLVSGKIVLVAT